MSFEVYQKHQFIESQRSSHGSHKSGNSIESFKKAAKTYSNPKHHRTTATFKSRKKDLRAGGAATSSNER